MVFCSNLDGLKFCILSVGILIFRESMEVLPAEAIRRESFALDTKDLHDNLEVTTFAIIKYFFAIKMVTDCTPSHLFLFNNAKVWKISIA